MIAVLVLFDLDEAVSPDEMRQMSTSIAPMYQGKPGLLTKHFVSRDVGARVGGFYLWESREAAEALYTSGQWLSEARQAFGGDPEITWFDCSVVVDNRHDELMTEAHAT